MRTDFVLDALEQALYDRQPERDGSLICHSDRGSQYVSIRYTERLGEAGIEPSVGSKGDSYANALAETINGLYKAELIHRRAPGRPRRRWSSRRSNGCPGSTTIACSNPSATSRLQKLRQTITGNSPVGPSKRRHDLNQPASMKAGAIHGSVKTQS
jgi:transposase InsO family protein